MCYNIYVSETYAGSACDRQIIVHFSLLTDYPFQSGDHIMPDRGIMVQDLFVARNVHVNTPHTLKGKQQLDATTVVQDSV